MAILAAREGALYVGGTPVTMTAEATTDSGDHKVFQITATSKRAIDPDTAVSVFVSGDEIASTLYAVDYAHGVITFASEYGEESAGDVTITGKYVPLLQVAETRSMKVIRPHSVMADCTRMGDTAGRTAEIAKRCAITVEHMTSATTDLDSGGGTTYLDTLVASGLLFVSANLGSGDKTLKGWFSVAGAGASHDLASILTHTLDLEGVVRTCTGRPATDQAIFSVR